MRFLRGSATSPPPRPSLPAAQRSYALAEQRGASTAIHPVIMGLLQLLPGEGQPFPKGDRQTWLQIMAVALEMIYGAEELRLG